MASESLTNTKIEFTTFYNVIDGKLDKGTETRHTINPASLEANPDVPRCTLDEADRAINVAQRAAKQWASVPWSGRKKALEGFTAALESHVDDFARLMTWEQGKTLFWARGELATVISFLKGFSNMSLPEEVNEDTEERKIITRYVPLGVVVGIAAWNFPIFIAIAKIAPAVLTGNAVILKPSPFAPYSGLKVAELGLQFFPPGVLQALSGDDSLGPFLTKHPLVNMVSFTGSIPTGKAIMKTCSETLKRVTLELGGNDPAIVCTDVDLADTVPKIVMYAFCNAGQLCVAIKRVYVHETIYNNFLAALVKHVESLVIGLGEDGIIGPVSNEPQFERVKKLLAGIKAAGLTIATGGTEPLSDRKGFYFAPTIIDNPPESSVIVQGEQFGPVLPLLKWSDESDVIQRANNGDTGLGASIWGRNREQTSRIAKQLQAGTVWVNSHFETTPIAPFSGHKQSGFGAEYGVDGLKAFCNAQAMYTRP